MNSQLLKYIQACREAGLSDNEIAENLLQVGWDQSEIIKTIKVNVDPQTLPEQVIPSAPQPGKPVIEVGEVPKSVLEEIKQSDVKKKALTNKDVVKKPRSSFIAGLKKRFAKKTPENKIKKGDPVTPKKHSNDQQIVIGPDGQKYQLYFYPVAGDAASGPILHGSNPVPISSIMPQYFQPREKEPSKFWNYLDIAKRVVILGALLFAIISVSLYFFDLQTKANKIGKNIDSATFDNMEQLRKKVESYYQANRKLPTTLSVIDPKSEYSVNKGSNSPYDYKIIDATNFQFCTVMSSGSSTYKSGYVCQPYSVNTMGMVSGGTPINPADPMASLPQTGSTPKVFPGCTNPKPLLSANAKCTDATGNCKKPMFNQEFGMSSAGLSNTKDRLAQTFALPKDNPATMVTEFAPFVLMASGGNACMAIYENNYENDPLSGREIAEYAIPLGSLKSNSYNPLYINPVNLTKGKSYSFVFSLLTESDSLTIARGMELSGYKDGTAYYLKRTADTCTKNCEPELWVNREDDLKFKIMFY